VDRKQDHDQVQEGVALDQDHRAVQERLLHPPQDRDQEAARVQLPKNANQEVRVVHGQNLCRDLDQEVVADRDHAQLNKKLDNINEINLMRIIEHVLCNFRKDVSLLHVFL